MQPPPPAEDAVDLEQREALLEAEWLVCRAAAARFQPLSQSEKHQLRESGKASVVVLFMD